MKTQISAIYKLAATINFLSEITDERLGLILRLIARELQKAIEEIDDHIK